MKVTVKRFNVDWLEIKNLCRQTVNMGDSQLMPTDEWKRKLLTARHSPLRDGTMLIKIENIPSYVHTHLVRHSIGNVFFVGTSREDRTGIPRSERKQTDLVNMEMITNIESLMNISEKRLCNCADIETIKVWKAVLEAVKEYDKNIYDYCVPSCVAHGACTEPFNDSCHFYENLTKNATKKEVSNIENRYKLYNEHREKTLKMRNK